MSPIILTLPLTTVQITVFESIYTSAVHFYMSYSIKIIELFHVSLIIVLHERACVRTEAGRGVCGAECGENLIALIDYENVSDPLLFLITLSALVVPFGWKGFSQLH